MKRLLVILPCLATTAAIAGPTAYGEGTGSCAQWSDDAKSSQGVINHMIWMGGYVTAYNTFASPSGNIAQYSKLDGVVRWMDNYCEAHPLVLAGDAAVRLITALSPRRKKR